MYSTKVLFLAAAALVVLLHDRAGNLAIGSECTKITRLVQYVFPLGLVWERRSDAVACLVAVKLSMLVSNRVGYSSVQRKAGPAILQAIVNFDR